ncbi:MAG: rod shape-determining protein MreC [Phycisphaerales bacterium]|nr:MAG: rod shape-determining protein MreC [Phycisphaerales bacterium]
MYRRRRSRKASVRTIFFLLVLLAFLIIWLPSAWTRPLNNVMQLLAPAEDILNRVGHAADSTLDDWSGEPVPHQQFAEYQDANRHLTNTVVSLSARVAELEQLNRELTHLRDAGFPREGRLIPARVLRRDAVAWRDALLLDKGAASSARPDAPVISRCFVNIGAETGVTDGMAVLAGEVLVGRVLSSAPYTSSVLLLSDTSHRMTVLIGRMAENGWDVLPAEFLLQGVGRGRMIIEDVDHKYIEQGQIRPGDLVVSPPGHSALPLALTIGRVVEIEPHSESPLLLYRLQVEPAAAYDQLASVYVVDTTPRSNG